MPLLIKTAADTWSSADHYVKTGDSTWSLIPQIYVKTGSGWKPLYSMKWVPQAWGACSQACGGGTQSRVVQCVRNDGRVLPDSACIKHVGAKPPTHQFCNTHSCTYYWAGHSDDWAGLSIYHPESNSYEFLFRGTAPGETYTMRPITSSLFAKGGNMYMSFEQQDWNGTSYSASLKMCTNTNRCTDFIVYFPKQGQCNGGIFWFVWNPDTMAVAHVRCAGWKQTRHSAYCSGCSACSDSGWGYLNCDSNYPAWTQRLFDFI